MTNNSSNGKTTVLVIDDEHQFSQNLVNELGASHFDVHRACSAQEAIELLDYVNPDAILVDMILPDVSGLSLLRRLRSSSEHGQRFIVMTSGLEMEGDEIEALNAGANKFLVKPFSLNDFELVLSTNGSNPH
jgi:two-component system sensor histidine kinase ChiS